ncbi:MAG: hypothetical protein WCJ57_03720 [Candidatus Falkowbacteria bacterium]
MKRMILVFVSLLVASLLTAQTSMLKAKDIMGKNFYGPQEIGKALNLKIDSSAVPSIPFSGKELERANSLGLILILRLPISIDSLNCMLKGRLPNNSKLLFNYDLKQGQLKKELGTPKKIGF